jgi:FKBP-type peptidyl-prolyl cis-trans isomerase
MVKSIETKKILTICILLSALNYIHAHNERRSSMNSQNCTRTTPSGLKIEILEPSTVPHAKKPQVGREVTVHYTGWLMTENGEKGAMFDSSHKRGQPFKFVLGVGKVIKGWDEGIALLVVGDKARLTIPANLAYGNRSVGGLIPANAILIFDVELVDAA